MKLSNPISVSEAAGILHCEFAGKPDHLIEGINEIHRVEAGDLTFVDHPKYYDKALSSAATIIIINRKQDAPQGKALLFSDDPFRDYNKMVSRFRSVIPQSSAISETATIGEGTVIQPGVSIGHHVKVGKNCFIHPNVVIYDHSIIGDDVIIHAGTIIGADAFYYKRRPEGFDKMRSCGHVELASKVEIGACCTIDKGVSSVTYIGEGSKLDNHIHIGHDTVIGKNVLIAAQTGIAGVVNIEDDVIIWGQVGVQKDLTIGKGAVILAQSGVGKSLKGGKTYFGSPAREAREKMKEMAYLTRLAAENI